MKNTKSSTTLSKKKFSVSITYTWEFNSDEWVEADNHMKELENDIHQKISYDAIDCFYHLNNICFPTSSYKIQVQK